MVAVPVFSLFCISKGTRNFPSRHKVLLWFCAPVRSTTPSFEESANVRELNCFILRSCFEIATVLRSSRLHFMFLESSYTARLFFWLSSWILFLGLQIHPAELFSFHSLISHSRLHSLLHSRKQSLSLRQHFWLKHLHTESSNNGSCCTHAQLHSSHGRFSFPSSRLLHRRSTTSKPASRFRSSGPRFAHKPGSCARHSSPWYPHCLRFDP